MNTDPYKVLGVPYDASDEDIKTAYRNLARKYHPDKYRESDLADLAGEKMKEINSAYEKIKEMRASGTRPNSDSQQRTSYGYSGYGAGWQAGSESPGGDAKYAEIRRMINSGYDREAERKLGEIPQDQRNAEWNFLMGCVMIKRGYFVDAQRYFDLACSMDPYNREYKAAQERLRMRANSYAGGYQTTQASGCSPCGICTGLLCADCCCNCCS